MANEAPFLRTKLGSDSESAPRIPPSLEGASEFLANQLSVMARIDGLNRDYSNPVSAWYYRTKAKPKSLISVFWDRKRISFNHELNMLAFSKDASYLCMLVAEHLRSPEIDLSEKILKSAESILKTEYFFAFQSAAKVNISRLIDKMVIETLAEKTVNQLPHFSVYIERNNELLLRPRESAGAVSARSNPSADAGNKQA